MHIYPRTTHSSGVGNNLKKSVYILNFLLILLAFSCGQNSSEKELNGNWREIENEYSTWHFYPDTIVFKLAGITEEKTEWQADKPKIELELPTFYWDSLGKIIDTINRVQINYQLSNKKDSLFGTLKNNYGVHQFSLLKTENYYDYLNRKFGIEFSLPKNNSAELITDDPIYGMKIFMGISNNKIKGRTEVSESLNNLEFDIKKFKDSIKPYEQHQIETHKMFLDKRFHLRVFADKNIPDSTITEYLKVTISLKNSEADKHIPKRFIGQKRDTLPIRIYRIFENKDTNPRNLKAEEIKTIANTVYN
jgi:hypothetical protein